MCVCAFSEIERGREREERERRGGGGEREGGSSERERYSHSPQQLLCHRSLVWCIPEKQTPLTPSAIPGTVQTCPYDSSQRTETQTVTIQTAKCCQINQAKKSGTRQLEL
jgi:hypothetical protein